MGDQVAEGDILAEYDLEDLQRLAQESKLLLAQKQSELDRLTQQKTDADAQLQQKIDQLRASGSEQKSAEQEALETEKQTLKNQLNGHRQTEQTARQEAEELLDKQQQRAQVIADCDSRLSQLEEQRAQLQQELDGLIAQGAPEEQLQEARRKLAQNEVDTADVQRTRDEAATADYEGQAAEKQRQPTKPKAPVIRCKASWIRRNKSCGKATKPGRPCGRRRIGRSKHFGSRPRRIRPLWKASAKPPSWNGTRHRKAMTSCCSCAAIPHCGRIGRES